jgi:hypothetical protein
LCVARGRPSRYSSAWAEDDTDIVIDVELESVYRRIIIVWADIWRPTGKDACVALTICK